MEKSLEQYNNQAIDVKELVSKLVNLKEKTNNAIPLLLKLWGEKISKSSDLKLTPQRLLEELHKIYYDFGELVKKSDDIEFRRLKNDSSRGIGLRGDLRDLLENNLPEDFGIVFSGMDVINKRLSENEEIDLKKLEENMIYFREKRKNEIKKVFESGFFDEYLKKANKI